MKRLAWHDERDTAKYVLDLNPGYYRKHPALMDDALTLRANRAPHTYCRFEREITYKVS